MSLVKNIFHVIEPFRHLCNLSLNSGVFPDNMKIARAITGADFKKGLRFNQVLAKSGT